MGRKVLLKRQMYERIAIFSARQQQAAAPLDELKEFLRSVRSGQRVTLHLSAHPAKNVGGIDKNVRSVRAIPSVAATLHFKSDTSQPPFFERQVSGTGVDASIFIDRLQVCFRNAIVQQRPLLRQRCFDSMNQGHHSQQVRNPR